jgi:hypothetical protein
MFLRGQTNWTDSSVQSWSAITFGLHAGNRLTYACIP